MSSDFKIIAGQAIPALTFSLPFNCDIHLEKIFNSTAPSQSIKAFTSQNGFLFVDQPNQPDLHWVNLIEIARNCSEHNVTLNRLNGSNQLQLCTNRSLKMDECLKLWPSHSLLNEWKIPDYLQLANFLGINQYKCTNCSKIYEEPNQLKVHIALSCNKLFDQTNVNNLTNSLSNNLNDNQLITQLIAKQSTCNSLLFNHTYPTSPSLQFKNSTNLEFNPFNFTLPNCNLISKETILKANLNSNLNSLNNLNQVLISPTNLTNSDNLTILNNLNNNNLINHNINNLISINNNYLGNHLNSTVKRRKLEDNDLISTLNKLNNLCDKNQLNNQLNNRLNAQLNIQLSVQSNDPLNGTLSNGNQLNRLNKSHSSLDKFNINLIDSDQSVDTNDEIVNNDKVTSSSMALINANNLPTKNRAMKLTKEPRTHTCKFCGKLYTRKYGLKIHIRTHTGHKPLKCLHCSRQFSDPSNLNKHHRLHQNSMSTWNKRC